MDTLFNYMQISYPDFRRTRGINLNSRGTTLTGIFRRRGDAPSMLAVTSAKYVHLNWERRRVGRAFAGIWMFTGKLGMYFPDSIPLKSSLVMISREEMLPARISRESRMLMDLTASVE